MASAQVFIQRCHRLESCYKYWEPSRHPIFRRKVMINWKTCALVAAVVTAAGLTCAGSPHNNIPSDFRNAITDNSKISTTTTGLEKDKGNIAVSTATAVDGVSKSHIAGKNDSPTGAPSTPIEWIAINGGKFMMGTDTVDKGFEDAKQIHEVAIKTFDMSKTLVTVEQYAECVIQNKCTAPDTGHYGFCNWGVAGRQLHPVNCVDWDQANQYAKFKHGRLPSESEWEYAARSGGKNQKYPWGDEAATCDKAVMYGKDATGCDNNSTMPVCSKTAGNTAQGLCDMAGNVWQWVQDKYQNSYTGAPADGGAFEGAGTLRVLRGDSFLSSAPEHLRADNRHSAHPDRRAVGFGFRLAK